MKSIKKFGEKEAVKAVYGIVYAFNWELTGLEICSLSYLYSILHNYHNVGDDGYKAFVFLGRRLLSEVVGYAVEALEFGELIASKLKGGKTYYFPLKGAEVKTDLVEKAQKLKSILEKLQITEKGDIIDFANVLWIKREYGVEEIQKLYPIELERVESFLQKEKEFKL